MLHHKKTVNFLTTKLAKPGYLNQTHTGGLPYNEKLTSHITIIKYQNSFTQSINSTKPQKAIYTHSNFTASFNEGLCTTYKLHTQLVNLACVDSTPLKQHSATIIHTYNVTKVHAILRNTHFNAAFKSTQHHLQLSSCVLITHISNNKIISQIQHPKTSYYERNTYHSTKRPSTSQNNTHPQKFITPVLLTLPSNIITTNI
eukprot:gene2777-1762_t